MALLAPCPDVPVSIAQCVKENRACKTCLPAAQLLLKQVQAGKAKKEREEARERWQTWWRTEGRINRA